MQSFYTMDECYKILGLDPKTPYSILEIKKAYHDKALIYHPDKNPGDPLAEEIFIKIKEAFEVITNPSFAHQKFSKSSHLNLIINFESTFNDGFFGKVYEFNFNRSAEFIATNKLDLLIDPISFMLPMGSGGVFEKHFASKGFKKGGEVGDLLVRINISSHKIFILQGNNIVSNVSVPLSYFIKGGKMEIPTMYGLREIKIKPGMKPGTSINIINCGVGRSNYHIAILNVVFPSESELKTGDWNKLDINWEI